MIDWSGDWVFPLPTLVVEGAQPRVPLVTQEFRSPTHYGVDVTYARPRPEAGTVPVLAARKGTLWSAQKVARGWQVVIDHGKPWATFYTHIQELSPALQAALAAKRVGVSSRDPAPIEAGADLGMMGYDPTDPERVVHLHFATWYQGAGDPASVDPAAQMASWRRVLRSGA